VLGFAGPKLGEVGFLGGDARVIAQPGTEDVQAFPIPRPPGFRLVQAAVEGEAVAGLVFDDAGLLVEDALGRHGATMLVARHGDLHFQDLTGDHPREQFERLDFPLVAGLERIREQVRRYLSAALRAFGDGFDLRRVQRASSLSSAHPKRQSLCG